jgi:predicted nucleic acid-binding Zn ribbon protein
MQFLPFEKIKRRLNLDADINSIQKYNKNFIQVFDELPKKKPRKRYNKHCPICRKPMINKPASRIFCSRKCEGKNRRIETQKRKDRKLRKLNKKLLTNKPAL